MENNVPVEIMDKLKKVCVCKVINAATIKKSIREGADTLEKVKSATGAATGCCKGARCIAKIETMIKEVRGNNI